MRMKTSFFYLVQGAFCLFDIDYVRKDKEDENEAAPRIWITFMSKSRLQFDFSEGAINELDQLQEKTGLPTRAELIRQSLRLLQWMLTETLENGATFIVEKNGKQREIVFPFWPVKKKEAALREG